MTLNASVLGLARWLGEPAAEAALGLDATLEEDGMEESHGRVALMRRAEADGSARSARGPRLDKRLAGEIVDVLLTARRVLDRDGLPHPEHVVDHDAARAVLKEIWVAAMGAMTTGPASVTAGGSAVALEVVGLLRSVKELDEKVLMAQVRYREQALARVRDGLSMLAEAKTSKGLLDLAPVAACEIGFDRCIVSRVEEAVWIPQRVHFKDARWAKEILEAGQTRPGNLAARMVETEMVRRRRPILVYDVQDRQDLHVDIARISKSRSYCAAPVSVHGSVAGIVHVDCFYQRRDVDESDRQVLSMFAEGLGQALSRTMVLDHLEAIRGELDRLSGQLAAAIGGLGGVGWGGGGESAPTTDPVRSRGGVEGFLRSAPVDPTLTRREVEVLRLMAAGDTNARIARRLVISEGTVKSHVKHILRKLGAGNRAEAVSHWLHMSQGDGYHSARLGGPRQ